MAFIYVPNGMHMPDWTPKEVGKNFTLPYIREPLKPYQDQLTVLSGHTGGVSAAAYSRATPSMSCDRGPVSS